MADGSITIDTKLDSSGFDRGLSTLGKSIGVATAAVAAMGAAAVGAGSQFETSLAKASTLFGDVAVNTDALSDKILALSDKTGIASSAIGDSLYNALSASIPASEDMGEAMSYMESCAKLAKAGFTDVDTAVTATAKVLNAYKLDVSDTDRVHRVLMQTQNKGITTVDELGGALAQCTPTAAAMKMSFEQVGASLATMTAQGIPTAQATTYLNGLLSELGKEGTTAAKNLAAASEGTQYAGKSFSDLMAQGVPLNEVLGLMGAYAQESGLSMIDMFSSVEAGKAALAMSGENSRQFADNLSAMGTTADVVGDAYGKMADTLEHNFGRVQNNVKNLGIALYQDLGGPLSGLAGQAADMISQLTDAFKSGGLDALISAAGDVVAQLVERIANGAPKLIGSGVALIDSLLVGVSKNAGKIADGAAKAVAEFIKGVAKLAPKLLSAGIKIVTELVKGLAKQIPEIAKEAPKLIKELVNAVTANLPGLVKAGIELVKALIQGLLSAIPEIVRELPKIVKAIVDTLVSSVGDIAKAGVELFTGLLTAIPEIISELVTALPEIIAIIVTGLLAGVGEVFAAAVELFFGITSASSEAREELAKIKDVVTPFSEALDSAAPSIADYSRLLSTTGKTAGQLDADIEKAENHITEVLGTALSSQQGLRAEDLQDIERYTDEIARLQQEKLELYRGQQIAELRKAQLEADSIDQEGAAQHLANIQSALEASNQITEEAYTAEITRIENLHKAKGDINSTAYQQELEAAKLARDAQLAENQAYADQTLEIVASAGARWVEADAGKWAALSEMSSAWKVKDISDIEKWGVDMASRYGAGWEMARATFAQELGAMDAETNKAFMQMALTVASRGDELPANMREIAANMLSSMEDLPGGLDDIAKDALLGLIAGMENQIPGLENASEMTADEIVETIKDYLGIASPSTVLQEVGGFAGDGLIEGMTRKLSGIADVSREGAQGIVRAFESILDRMRSIGVSICAGVASGMLSQVGSLLSTARDIAGRINKAFKAKLEINSPSRLTAREVGKPTAQGVGVGFKEEMRRQVDDMRAAMATQMMRVSGAITGPAFDFSPALGASPGGVTFNVSVCVDRMESDADIERIATSVSRRIGRKISAESRLRGVF